MAKLIAHKKAYFRIAGWWKNLSVSKKLYSVVGVMALLIAMELFTLLFAMNVLSSVRAFVGGEGLWSKAQKNALFEMQKYITSHEDKDYQAFLENLKVNMGDRQARLEMMKPELNMKLITEGFVAGKNHENDIPGMVRLMTKFHHLSYIKRCIEVWGEADAVMAELQELGTEIHVAIQQGKLKTNSAASNIYVDRLSEINGRLTVLEDEFSFTLGQASRWLESWLVIILVIAVILVEGSGLFLTISFTRGLGRVLFELNDAADEIGRGNFYKRVPVRSRDELGQLAAAINVMTQNLRSEKGERLLATEASEIKSLFLANMSHEIRTPLGAILGFVELLRDPKITDKERSQYLDIVQRTGESLNTIINDILDISKVEAGKLEVMPVHCSLPDLLKDLRLLLKLRCDDKGIHLRLEGRGEIPECIYTDGARLRQILLNVIGNAIKFTVTGGVDVVYRVKNGFLEFTVSDTGIGISPQEKNKLFRPFSQVDLSIRKVHGGTGLGLVLSKRLAELLGGDVILEKSEKGKGSVFIVTVQMENPGGAEVARLEPRQPMLPSHPNPLQGKKILVVEDSVDNQFLIEQLLQKSGATVEVCENGLLGRDRALAKDFDLVLMDMQMPVMDGYTATTELRKKNYQVPIIALTAHAMKEDLEKCLQAGCDAVLTKPFKISALVEVLATYTQKGSKRAFAL